MKHCYFCNKDIIDDAKHCPKCGKPLEIMCKRCHEPMPNGIDFCPNCGAKTEIKLLQEKNKEKATKNFWTFIGSIVLAIIITVVFAPASVPFWYIVYHIYQNSKEK